MAELDPSKAVPSPTHLFAFIAGIGIRWYCRAHRCHAYSDGNIRGGYCDRHRALWLTGGPIVDRPEYFDVLLPKTLKDAKSPVPVTSRSATSATAHDPQRNTLSIMKACEAVGVSRRTIYNWIAAGKVEYVRTAGGSIRIFADTLWRDVKS